MPVPMYSSTPAGLQPQGPASASAIDCAETISYVQTLRAFPRLQLNGSQQHESGLLLLPDEWSSKNNPRIRRQIRANNIEGSQCCHAASRLCVHRRAIRGRGLSGLWMATTSVQPLSQRNCLLNQQIVKDHIISQPHTSYQVTQ